MHWKFNPVFHGVIDSLHCHTHANVCVCVYTLLAARACCVPGGQSVGLWGSSAEGLALTHSCTAADPFLLLLLTKHRY